MIKSNEQINWKITFVTLLVASILLIGTYYLVSPQLNEEVEENIEISTVLFLSMQEEFAPGAFDLPSREEIQRRKEISLALAGGAFSIVKDEVEIGW